MVTFITLFVSHWVEWGTGTPEDKDEVNRREVCESNGSVCDRDTIGVPSIFKVIRSDGESYKFTM
jgi:hypothetical protein